MGVRTLSLLVGAILFNHFVAGGYQACGGSDVAVVDLDETIEGHVKRLLALRSSNFAWENTPEMTTAIQISMPDHFNNMDETVRRLETELSTNGTSMSLGKLSQYLLAAKATCQDVNSFGGFDLISQLEQRFQGEFIYDGERHKTPKHGWYGFYLALGAYCISQKQSPLERLIHRALHSQNDDGSFDHSHSLDHTAQAMLSLACLLRLNSQSETIQRKIDDSLNLASQFVRSKVITERDNVWIGDKYSSPTAVLAIKEHSDWSEDQWKCRLIMRSLNRRFEDDESESAIAQRLMALKGSSVLALMDDSYSCEESHVSEDNVPPVTEKRPSYTCELEDDEFSRFPFSATLIDVHISVHNNAFAHDESSQSQHFTLRDVKKGKTLHEIMTISQCQGLVSFETKTTSWGEYVTAINGVLANSENKEYWAITNNGVSLSVGIGQFQPSHGDRISFRLKKWQ